MESKYFGTFISDLAMILLPPDYCLEQGSTRDRALLVKFMQQTYEELFPGLMFDHLARTIEQFFSSETPLWWIAQASSIVPQSNLTNPLTNPMALPKVACLWLGSSTDQVRGDRNTYIFLLYVHPNHRRKGLGTALMTQAEQWTKLRGDRQITLQVFQQNAPALSLYQKLGFQTQSVWLAKEL
jgi:GNAT superfamily N-acetyltransferase